MKKKPWGSPVHATLYAAVLAGMMGCAGKQPAPGPTPAVTQAPLPQAVAEPKEAKAILLRMAEFLARTPRFSVTVQGDYDVVQESGEKLEFGETRQVTVGRPDHLRVEAEHSNGERHLVLYDGKDITVVSPQQNVYAQAAKPGGIDAAVMYFVRDLRMRLPFALLLVSRFPEEIQQRTESLDYVEKTRILGTPAYHLAGRTESVDYQVWIAEGSKPLPLRAVLTYRNADGQPQFRANFVDWNLSPEIQDAQFVYNPPEGARKIAFQAELSQVAPPGAAAPSPSGEQK